MSDIYSLLHWWMRCFSCLCGVNSIHLFFPFLLSTITGKHRIFVLLFSGPWTVPLRPHPLQPHGNICKVMLIVRCIVNFTTSTHLCRSWLTGIWATTQRANMKCFAASWNRKRKSESKEAMCFLTIRWHNNYDTGPLSLQLQSVWSVIYFNTALSGFNVRSCYFFLLDRQFITARLWRQWLNLSRDQLVTSTSIAHHIEVFDFLYL